MIVARASRRGIPACAIDVLSADPASHRRDLRRRGDAAVRRAAGPRLDRPRRRRALGRRRPAAELDQHAQPALLLRDHPRRAVRAKKPAMIFAQSIGPLDLRGRRSCVGVAAASAPRPCATSAPRAPARLLPQRPGRADRRSRSSCRRAGRAVRLRRARARPGCALRHRVGPRGRPDSRTGRDRWRAAVDRLAGRVRRLVAFLPLGGAPTPRRRRCHPALPNRADAASALHPGRSGAGDRCGPRGDRDAPARADLRGAVRRPVPRDSLRPEGRSLTRRPALSAARRFSSPRRRAATRRSRRPRRSSTACGTSTTRSRRCSAREPPSRGSWRGAASTPQSPCSLDLERPKRST